MTDFYEFPRVVDQLDDTTRVVSHLIPVDGRVSWLPPTADGWDPWNHYVIDRGDALIVLDSGLAAYGPSLVEWLKPQVQDRRLIVYITRIEPDATGNLGRFIDEFEQFEIVSSNPLNPADLVHWHYRDHRPRPELHRFRYGETLDAVGLPGFTVLEPGIRTLGTSWLQDDVTGVLYTTDAFGFDLIKHLDQSLVRRDGDFPAATQIFAHLTAKFDWLLEAHLDKVRETWDRVIERLSPTAIAPIHGRPVVGRALAADTISRTTGAIFENALTPERFRG